MVRLSVRKFWAFQSQSAHWTLWLRSRIDQSVLTSKWQSNTQANSYFQAQMREYLTPTILLVLADLVRVFSCYQEGLVANYETWQCCNGLSHTKMYRMAPSRIFQAGCGVSLTLLHSPLLNSLQSKWSQMLTWAQLLIRVMAPLLRTSQCLLSENHFFLIRPKPRLKPKISDFLANVSTY